ncbi:hypothetical protein [Streptomyces sp. NPDC051079]|uniref:hypothetical protein n=1 Tax=Streptomyces sp. NPDC051079 TaxID=3155043 RepID=UPI00344D5219
MTITTTGTRPLVVGLDLSLTSTGIAGTDWADVIKPRTRGHQRMSWLLMEILDRVKAADLIVVEGPSYKHGGEAGAHERAGMWWLVTHALWRRDMPVAVCPPAQRAMYATGKGNAGKGEVRDGVQQYFGVACEGAGRYDKADAVSMACLGAAWLGYPVADLPAAHTRALTGVAWPETVPAVAR